MHFFGKQTLRDELRYRANIPCTTCTLSSSHRFHLYFLRIFCAFFPKTAFARRTFLLRKHSLSDASCFVVTQVSLYYFIILCRFFRKTILARRTLLVARTYIVRRKSLFRLARDLFFSLFNNNFRRVFGIFHVRGVTNNGTFVAQSCYKNMSFTRRSKVLLKC